MISRHTLAVLLLVLLAYADAFAQRPELVVQTGDAGGPDLAAFSPDGRLIATAGKVRLWETATGRKLRDFNVEASCLAFSLDGQTLLAADGTTVLFWDVLTGRELRRFNIAPGGLALAQAFSPDRRIFATGSLDGLVTLWDMNTGRLLHTMRAPGMKVYAVAFSPDGRTIVGGGFGQGQPLRFWSVATGAPLGTSVVPAGIVNTLAYSPDGRLVASDDRNTIKLWDARTKRVLRTLTRDVDSFNIVVFSPDGRTLASQAPTKTGPLVDLWDVATGRLLRESQGNTPLAFSYDGKTMAIGSRADVKLLDAATDQERAVLRAHAPYINVVTFSPDGRMLAALTAGRPHTVKLWNVSTGRELTTLKADTNNAAPSLAFSPDSQRLASPSSYVEMRLWDTLTGAALMTWGKEYYTPFSRVLYFPDGRYVVTMDYAGGIIYWDATTAKPYGSLKGIGVAATAAVISPNGRLLAVGGSNKTVTVWDVATAQKRFELRGHTETIYSVAFSPGGQMLASAGDDKMIKLWDMETGAELRTLRGHTDRIDAIAYSPDGKTLVSAGFNGALKLWAADTGRELYALRKATDGSIESVAYSADGKMVAAAGFGDGVHLFDTATGQELATLVAVDENDYLIVTPDGLFDGSPAAWGLVLWRFGQNTFDVLPAEAFFNEFFYPGLLADLFAGRRPKAARDIAQKDRRQPELQIEAASAVASTADTRQVTVKVAVTKAEAGAQDVRLFRNGSLIKFWRGDALKGQSRGALLAVVPIVAGENRFTAYAFNHDNIKSADATLSIKGADSLKRKGMAYVVTVGINQYAPNPFFRNLKYAVADADDFAAEVKTRQERLAQFERVEVVKLTNNEATKVSLLDVLAGLAKKAQPEDTIVVYFAGHGLAEGGRFYLIPHDIGVSVPINPTDEQTTLDAMLAAHGISDIELEDAVEGIDAGQLILIVDACNSGQALGAEKEGRGPMNSKGLAQLAYDKGMYILTAAQSFQAAQEAAQVGHGLLTYALVEEGLKQALADDEPKDGQIMAREWLDYATGRVPQMQLDKMKAARGLGLDLSFKDEERGLDSMQRSGQRPRVFYRRELEARPIIIAKTIAVQH